jgi:UDP-glucose 4-epimerase
MLNNIDYWSDAPVWDRDSISKATKNWFKYLSSE